MDSPREIGSRNTFQRYVMSTGCLNTKFRDHQRVVSAHIHSTYIPLSNPHDDCTTLLSLSFVMQLY